MPDALRTVRKPNSAISKGNEKLGNIPSWSTTPVSTCPGRTEWCSGEDPTKPKTLATPDRIQMADAARARRLAKAAAKRAAAEQNGRMHVDHATLEELRMCYSLKTEERFPAVALAWAANVGKTPSPGEVSAAAATAHAFRIHVAGDLDTVEYIELWTALIKLVPDVSFWAYTRSWRIPWLLESLEELRALSNMQLFASEDATSGTAPAGWRVAYSGPFPEGVPGPGYPCPEQKKERRNKRGEITRPAEKGWKASCADCTFCYLGRSKNVIFTSH